MTTLLELSMSDTRDAMGHLFRDWHVVGWEEGRVPPGYVCELYCDFEPKPIAQATPLANQLPLF